MFPKPASRFREGRHAGVQATGAQLDEIETEMRDLGAYRMSRNSRALIEGDRTPRKQYGDFPCMPDGPKDYAAGRVSRHISQWRKTTVAKDRSQWRNAQWRDDHSGGSPQWRNSQWRN